MANKKFVTVANGGKDTRAVSFDEAHIPSAGQKAALPGTHGTPGDINRYVTDSDPRLNGGSGIPSGMIIDWCGDSEIPSGYLICNGAEISRLDFATLFSIIGTYYGDGDGFSTFNLPLYDRNFSIFPFYVSNATLLSVNPFAGYQHTDVGCGGSGEYVYAFSNTASSGTWGGLRIVNLATGALTTSSNPSDGARQWVEIDVAPNNIVWASARSSAQSEGIFRYDRVSNTWTKRYTAWGTRGMCVDRMTGDIYFSTSVIRHSDDEGVSWTSSPATTIDGVTESLHQLTCSPDGYLYGIGLTTGRIARTPLPATTGAWTSLPIPPSLLGVAHFLSCDAFGVLHIAALPGGEGSATVDVRAYRYRADLGLSRADYGTRSQCIYFNADDWTPTRSGKHIFLLHQWDHARLYATRRQPLTKIIKY